MVPASSAAVAILLLFVVPGFIAIQAKRRLVVLKPQSQFEEVLSSVAISAVLLVIVEIVSRWLTSQPFFDVTREGVSWQPAKAMFWIRYAWVLILAAAGGMGWAFLLRTALPEGLQKIGFRVGVIPGAWDHLFSTDNDWIRVHLVDGWIVDGWKRYASAYPDSHDLLVADASLYDDNSSLRSRCDELFLAADRIAFVEHRPRGTG